MVVVDDTLLDSVDVTAGLKETGAIVINTTKDGEELKKHLKGYNGAIYSIDARKISQEALGRYFPNTPMLAAIIKVAGIMSDEALLKDMEGSFKHKFAKKPEVIEGNMKALELALKEFKNINIILKSSKKGRKMRYDEYKYFNTNGENDSRWRYI